MNVTENGAAAMNAPLMEELLSEEALDDCIAQLRNILTNVGGGILFFDIRSFFAYIEYYLGEADRRNVARLLNVLEPYIPIVVSDEDIETFLEAAVRNDIDEVRLLEARFKASSKIKFIRALAIEEDQLWAETLDTCRSLRNYRADGMFL